MKLDAHNHFWKYDPKEYDWISEEMAVIQKDFMPKDLEKVQRKLGFDGTIAVQARQTLEETRALLKFADQNDRIKGVVGWVDLRSPELSKQLLEFAPHPKFVGVRHVVQAEPDDRFVMREDFRQGISQLAAHGLTYDILTFPKQLPAALELVKEFPEQPFVIDHISKPFIKDQVIGKWATDIQAFRNQKHVMCKLSGMVTEADWKNWKSSDLLPYMTIALEAFGADRLMIGSDWPVCLVAGTYEEVMGVVIDFISSLTESEQSAILGDNCAQFYLGK